MVLSFIFQTRLKTSFSPNPGLGQWKMYVIAGPMQCQCKVPMQRQCNANVASIHCQCTANALPMHCQFTANASPMHRQCITNAVPMQYQCKANAVPMKCQCSVNAASIQCQCRSKDSQSGNSWYGTSHWVSSTY